jgi:hypothetical protein
LAARSTGLKTVVKEISPDSKLASTACNKLAPKILAQFKNVRGGPHRALAPLCFRAHCSARSHSHNPRKTSSSSSSRSSQTSMPDSTIRGCDRSR